MKRVFAACAACLLLCVPAMAKENAAAKSAEPRGKKIIATQDAPPAIGPYSQAVRVGALLFVSGSLGMDPATGQIVAGGTAAETEQALNNLGAILKAAGASFDNVVKTTIFVTDMADFGTVNGIYAKRFSDAPPARSTVAVKELPRNGKVEIEVIASLPRTKKPR